MTLIRSKLFFSDEYLLQYLNNIIIRVFYNIVTGLYLRRLRDAVLYFSTRSFIIIYTSFYDVDKKNLEVFPIKSSSCRHPSEKLYLIEKHEIFLQTVQ